MAQSAPMPEKMPLSGRFSVMPAYYLPKEKKRLSLSAWVAIISAVIVVAVIVVFVMLYSASKQQVVPVPTTETEQPAPEPTPTPTPTVTEPTPKPEPDLSQAVNLPVVVIGQYGKDTDTDQDALTDVEERLFLTSAAVPDTDQDGFIDGIEVENLYDPATPRALLEVSPQIKTVRNEQFGYQMLIPASWTATKLTPDGKAFQIKPDQGSEAMMVSVYENSDRLTVTEWYRKNAPSLDLTKFVDFKNEGGWNGIQSTDQTFVVAAYGKDEPGARAFIFVMHYDAGQETILRYPTIWEMMVNSLAVSTLPSPIPAP